MATVPYIDYEDASPEARAVFDEIMAARKIDWINNVWKALANDPPLLRRTWERMKAVMGSGGALDPVTKELLYVAVSITNGCDYCVASHSTAARRKGVTDAQMMELIEVVGFANEMNRYASALRLDVDPQFDPHAPKP